jgi:uncharacterized SAM-binding protein YcdF (DUF218 family)
MFFYVSKLLGYLLEPLNALILLQVAALLLLWRGWRRTGTTILAFTTTLMLSVAILPIGAMALRPLEQAVPRLAQLPARVDGIVLLGGSQDTALTEAYGMPSMPSDATRVTEFAALARHYLQAKLVFAGGSGDLLPKALTEADVLRRFMEQQGIDPRRLILEDKSRNTHENATFSYQLAAPKPDETWLLVTSASHMPRALAVFRKAGWTITAYPTTYKTMPSGGSVDFDAIRRFRMLDEAIHEWIGIVIYRMTGRL